MYGTPCCYVPTNKALKARRSDSFPVVTTVWQLLPVSAVAVAVAVSSTVFWTRRRGKLSTDLETSCTCMTNLSFRPALPLGQQHGGPHTHSGRDVLSFHSSTTTIIPLASLFTVYLFIPGRKRKDGIKMSLKETVLKGEQLDSTSSESGSAVGYCEDCNELSVMNSWKAENFVNHISDDKLRNKVSVVWR